MADRTDVVSAIEAGDAELLDRMVAEAPELAAARDDEGVSALLLARYRGRQDLVEILLRRAPALDVFEAAALGDAARLTHLIEDDPPVVTAWSPDGFTPLHLASFFGHTDVVLLLLDAGADPSSTSRNAMAVMPLHSAVAGRSGDVVERLVEAGADVNARQRHGWTALHGAAQHGDIAIIRYLLAHGAHPDSTNDEDKSAADLAKQSGHAEVERTLLAEIDPHGSTP
ncbi:ankyrin repeat domain-containing protein [soil metagenome]